jgi:hypothetical protein
MLLLAASTSQVGSEATSASPLEIVAIVVLGVLWIAFVWTVIRRVRKKLR